MVRKDTVLRTLLIQPQPLKRQRIKDLKERAGSWRALAKKLRYKSKSTIITAYAHPDRMTPKLAARIRNYELELEAETGNYFEVTLIKPKKLPKRFRVAVEPRKCAGHREWCLFEKPTDTFCNDECRELAQAKRAKKK